MGIQTRVLGRTGVPVTVLGYGAMELRGRPPAPLLSEAQVGRLLHAVLDGGINLIDTSIDYGRSEERIGRHLAKRRHEYFLASKCGCPPPRSLRHPGPPRRGRPHDWRTRNIRAGLDVSLRRLRTDYLDLLQVHESPSRSQLEADGTVAELLALRDQGKARFIGMSGTLPHLPDHIAMGAFDVFQIPYSAVQREHEALITAAAEAGAGILIRGGVARGAAAEDKAPAGQWQAGPLDLPAGEGERRWLASGIASLLEDAGMPAHEFILRFTLTHPRASSVIAGTARPDHLSANLSIAERGPLPDDLYEQALRLLPTAAGQPAEGAGSEDRAGRQEG